MVALALDDAGIPAHGRLVAAVHEPGALAGFELVRSGMSAGNLYARIPPQGPSHLPVSGYEPIQARRMTREDIADLRRRHRQAGARPLVAGLAAATTAFLKVSQPHVIVHLVRWNRRAALIAVLAIGLLVVATLPIIGTGIWVDWVEQLRRAADPNWAVGGPSLGRYLPPPLGTVIVVGCMAAVLAVPKANAAVWVGVLMVLGAPSVHTYYLLFLLPAMLYIRLEVSLIAAMLIAMKA